MTTYTLQEVQRAAVRCAHEEWERVVRDAPSDHDRIAHYHRVSGAGWALDGGEYDPSEDFWCGVYGGYCYTRVGDYLEEGEQCVDLRLAEVVGKHMFPSTARLQGGVKPWSELDGVSEPRIVDPTEMRPGDIPIVYTSRTNRVFGDHVTLARTELEVDDYGTYEGNATGPLGDESHGEGVIQYHRTVADTVVILRPRADWFTSDSGIDVQE